MTCVILFGGKGSRLKDLHRDNKCFIEVDGKPICYHVVKNLLKSFKKEDLILITNSMDVRNLDSVLFGFFKYHFKIKKQRKPIGVSHAIYSAIKNENLKSFFVCLGDFYSEEIHKFIKKSDDRNIIFLNKVANPQDYGVFDFKTNKIIEKPNQFVSLYAVRGFYKFDDSFIEKFKKTKKSDRNEFEIVDVINQYNSVSHFIIKKVFDLGSRKGLIQFKKIFIFES